LEKVGKHLSGYQVFKGFKGFKVLKGLKIFLGSF